MQAPPPPLLDGAEDDEDDLVAVLLVSLLSDNHTVREERAAASYARSLIRSQYRASLPERVGSFIDTEFKCIFRMTPAAMEALRNQLYPFLAVRLSQANIEARSKGNRRPLTVDEKVCLGLMFGGGVTLGGLLFGFHVSKTAIYHNFWQFVSAVIKSNVGEIRFPSTLKELQDASDAFQQTRCNHTSMYGCIGAGDGLGVRIQMPSKSESRNAIAFMNRKGFASVNVQGVASAGGKCIMLSINTPGSAHDSTAWEMSVQGPRFEAAPVVDPRTRRVFWLALDDAYGAGINKLCPWPGTGLITRAVFKDAFNYFLSGGNRNVVERLFGQVYQRWGILWRPIRFPLWKVPFIVQSLFQLHNFLKDFENNDLPTSGPGGMRADETRRPDYGQEGFDDVQYRQADLQMEDPELPRVRPGQCPVREEITQELEALGVARPNDGSR